MRSLEKRFNNIAEKNFNLSSYTCFARAISGQKFNKQTIHRWFKILVDKDDYCKKEKRKILIHLENLSNTLRTTKIEGKLAPQQVILPKAD
jgi:deoxyhypusine synthase